MHIVNHVLRHKRLAAFGVLLFSLLLKPDAARGQLITFSKQDLSDFTAQNPFERFVDGRPKIPDSLLQQARELSSEEVWAVLDETHHFGNQYADGFRILHPDKPMVGRAFTVQFMPMRADVEQVAQSKAKQHGLPSLTNQFAIDMLQPGDVLVVDIFGKKDRRHGRGRQSLLLHHARDSQRRIGRGRQHSGP